MAPKKKLVKKKKKEEDAGPEPERRVFFGNEYFGVIHTDPLQIQSLEGQATYTWPEEEIYYEGPMKGSAMTGDGKLTWPDGSKYEGGLHRGQREGQGSLSRADGVTYMGSWQKGVRHGQGRLNYADGIEVYYEGDWMLGKKHGHGKQVWPSGNVYTGNWDEGEMSGYGEMEWCHGDTYKGTWKKGVPHGEGEYCWASGNADYEEQQAINRYQGQWKEGKRHGRGVFIYGDGSRYNGDWEMGKKHGMAKVTFADGNVYEGPFRDDWVVGEVERLSKPIYPKAVLDLGGVDNPLRQTISILDCDAIEMPTLQIPDEEQRETHNILLRNLGDIKQVYFKYRNMMKRETEDPYCMSTLQLWLFFRDHGLVSPKCSYATLNRALNFGQRYYQEHCSGLLGDLKVLTNPMAGLQHASKTKKRSKDNSKRDTKRESKLQRDDTKRDSKLKQQPSAADLAEQAEPPVVEEPEVLKDGANQFFADGDQLAPVDDIHADNHQILLRHFFEIIVRVAIVRFPEYPTINEKVEELVTERLVARFDGETTACVSESEWIFEHCEHAPKAKFYPYVLDVFSRLGNTTGKFGPTPHLEIDWVSDLKATPQGVELNVDVSRRQAHVCGHRDDTVHVRDLVKLLKALGFTPKTLGPDELNGSFLFPDLDEDLDGLANIGMTKEGMLEVQRMTLAPTSGIEGLLGGFTTRGSMLEGFGESGGGESALNVLAGDKMLRDPNEAMKQNGLTPEEAVKLIDFTMPLSEALFIIIDQLAPETLGDLCIDPADGTPLFTLMDYELTPSEFVRFLYVFAQRRIKGGAGSGGGSQFQMSRPGAAEVKRYDCLEELQPWDVFDLFLQNILFPAFEQPYPCVEPEEPEEPAEEDCEDDEAADAEKLSATSKPSADKPEEAEEDAFSAFSTSKASKTSKQTPDGPVERRYNRELWKGFNASKGSRRMPNRMAASLQAPEPLERRASSLEFAERRATQPPVEQEAF